MNGERNAGDKRALSAGEWECWEHCSLPRKILPGVGCRRGGGVWGEWEGGNDGLQTKRDTVRKVSPDGQTAAAKSRLLALGSEPPLAAGRYGGQLPMDGRASSSFPSAGPLESKGSEMETTKDSLRQRRRSTTSLPLPAAPLLFSLPSTRPSTFHHPLFRPCLWSRLVYIGEARRSFWFRAQMALACLWQRIRPPVSPFASMCKRSGQRTSNRRRKKKGGKECEGEEGGREGEGEKKKAPAL